MFLISKSQFVQLAHSLINFNDVVKLRLRTDVQGEELFPLKL